MKLFGAMGQALCLSFFCLVFALVREANKPGFWGDGENNQENIRFMSLLMGLIDGIYEPFNLLDSIDFLSLNIYDKLKDNYYLINRGNFNLNK